MNSYFSRGEIGKLTVYKEERRWHFDFIVERVLPRHIFEWLGTQLEKHFQSIVSSVGFSVQARTEEGIGESFEEYWPAVREHLLTAFPSLKRCLSGQNPHLNGKQLCFSVSNETEAGLIKRKLPHAVNEQLRGCGFPPLTLDARIDQENKEKTLILS
jgi:DNA polymerase III, alpha subunit (gram-positive type)